MPVATVLSRVILGAALLLALPGQAAVPNSARGDLLRNLPDDALVARLLARHNSERAARRLAPLAWNWRLAQDAAHWGRELAATGSFEHAEPVQPTRDNPYGDAGENLWAGTPGAFSPEAMVDAWIAGRKWFRAGHFPNVADGVGWDKVGHYTQLIWPETRELGCALVAGRREDVLVCRYHPAGNVEGHYVG